MVDIIKKFILIVAGMILVLGIILVVVSKFAEGRKNNENEGVGITTEQTVFVTTTEATTEEVTEAPTEATPTDVDPSDDIWERKDDTTESAVSVGPDSGSTNTASQDGGQNGNAAGSGNSADAGNSEGEGNSADAGNASNNGSSSSASTNSGPTASGDLFNPSTLTDTEAPRFLIVNKNINIPIGSAFDPSEYMGYGDDVDRNVNVAVTGNIDTNEEGSYPVTITLSDSTGKTNSATVTVNVTAASSGSSEGGGGGASGSGESFESFMENYKTDNTSLGIDVSRWQKTIDFEKVKAAGCDFAIIRIGGYDDGSLYTDRCYVENIQNAKAAGLKIGIYWHAEESSAEEVKASVRYLTDVLGGETLDFPIVYDWEDFAGFQNYNMNFQDLNDCYTVFASELKHNGYDACLYSSKNFLEGVWKQGDSVPIWLANYTSQTKYQGEYFMWQQASNGRIDGISGNVDFNVLYLDKFSY